MKRIPTAVLALALLVAAVLPARADDAVFAGIGERAVTQFIQPGYDRLAKAGAATERAMGALCAAPSPKALDAARAQFGDLVRAWSAVELIRFGPVREDNRYERIFFWPDGRGIGLREVQAALAERDEKLLTPGALAAQSVAMQGLGALEFVLYGSGADLLGDAASEAGYRCRYGAAVARAIAANTAAVAAEWRTDDGYVRLMLAPGDDNPVYRSHAEVVRELLGAMTQELEFVRDAKLLDTIGETAADARPKRAPFWRARLTLAALDGNVASVLALYESATFAAALDVRDRWINDNLAFELTQARGAWAKLPFPFVSAAVTVETHELLAYSRIPLAGAQRLLSVDYAGGTGLIVGFNALDGD